MHEHTVSEAFTRQAESFNRSPVANAQALLDQIVELAQPSAGQRWLELACGPGIIARRLAPLVDEVHGVDATPAMVELAEREAARERLSNLHFHLGNATVLSIRDGDFDGVVARFALHHIPLPIRVFEEAARVVRPGGRVVIVDHVGDTDATGFAWTQAVERLRDPSHWATLSAHALRALGDQAGLELETDRLVPIDLDFDEWLARGEAGADAAKLVERLISERPGGTDCFALQQSAGGRTLRLQIWLSAWRAGPDPG